MMNLFFLVGSRPVSRVRGKRMIPTWPLEPEREAGGTKAKLACHDTTATARRLGMCRLLQTKNQLCLASPYLEYGASGSNAIPVYVLQNFVSCCIKVGSVARTGGVSDEAAQLHLGCKSAIVPHPSRLLVHAGRTQAPKSGSVRTSRFG